MPSLAAGLAAERRRKNAKHARRLEKKLGVKVAGSEERRLSGVFGHSVSVLSTGLSRTFSRRRSSDAFDMSRAEQLAQESRGARASRCAASAPRRRWRRRCGVRPWLLSRTSNNKSRRAHLERDRVGRSRGAKSSLGRA